MILIESKFSLGKVVYLKTDPDQLQRLVIGICIRPSGTSYELACGALSTWHYDVEIHEEKNVLINSSN